MLTPLTGDDGWALGGGWSLEHGISIGEIKAKIEWKTRQQFLLQSTAARIGEVAMDSGDVWLNRQDDIEREFRRGFGDGLDGDLPESPNPDYLEGYDEGRKWPGSIVGE